MLPPQARARLRGMWVAVGLLTAMLIASGVALAWKTATRAHAEVTGPGGSRDLPALDG